MNKMYGENAIAAAEVVAVLRGQVGRPLSDEVATWITSHPLNVKDKDVALAITAVDCVLSADSELRLGWDETGDYDWHIGTTGLRRRLESA